MASNKTSIAPVEVKIDRVRLVAIEHRLKKDPSEWGLSSGTIRDMVADLRTLNNLIEATQKALEGTQIAYLETLTQLKSARKIMAIIAEAD